ncbi:MAG TPA: double-strand break repair protein AddB [Caulobacteraceae bacterium]
MSSFLDLPAPRWLTIPAHRPFLDDLAVGVTQALQPLGPTALADAVIMVPTRRAARALAEAFLGAASAGAVLLPQIRAIGDLDEGEAPFEPGNLVLELPPAIGAWRRRFELARLVAENEHLIQRRLDAGAALELADALGAFLDGCQIEEVGDPAAVEALVEGDFARHWQVSARFLNLALRAWPERLAQLGLIDVAARRVALLRKLAATWEQRPPDEVLIAAGSTGSAPATADLLAAIARTPNGCVVLPGLDRSLADAAWDEVGDQHPQGALRRLLDRAGVSRAAVADWNPAAEASSRGRWRRRILSEALRPADRTADWLEEIAQLKAEGAEGGVDPIAQGLEGLTLLTARTQEEQATVAALLLREALEVPGRTAALITPDAALARRVSARLTRWNVSADSSAGEPLAAAPIGVLATLVARAAKDAVDPVTLLAIVKHPLTRLGMAPDDLAAAHRLLERYALRGPRPKDWSDLHARLAARAERGGPADLSAAIDLARRAHRALDGLDGPYTGETATPAEAARALAQVLEMVAAGPDGGIGDLWAGLAGECAVETLAALIGESEGLPEVTRAGFFELVDHLMAGATVRSGYSSHPRLRIMGVLEARLLQADVTILAGLEEGVWPQAPAIDPFLSRPMRLKLGLPSQDRRIGLSAHDFAQAAAAPHVVLLHAERREGGPAVASRWLWRLRTLARGADVGLPGRPDILAWARTLDAPLSPAPDVLQTAQRPAPTPPLEARPRRMAVTGVERWVRDPYAVYARDILGLFPLDRPDEPVEAAARGSAIHAALEQFVKAYPEALPDDAHLVFATMLIDALVAAGVGEGRMSRERHLAANLAPWVVAFEARRRLGVKKLHIEQAGEIVFDAPGGPFRLTARADRIEQRERSADILDFKSGQAPSAKVVKAHFAPQLTLTAAILARGGFLDLGETEPGELLYVRINGGRLAGEELPRGEAAESAALAAAAFEGLRRRVAAFDNPATPYRSWAAPQFIDQYDGDYDHLARLWEWHVIGRAEPGAAD